MIIQNVTAGATAITVRIHDVNPPENFKDVHDLHCTIIRSTVSVTLENDARTITSYTSGDISKYITAGYLVATSRPFTSEAAKTKINACCVALAIAPLP